MTPIEMNTRLGLALAKLVASLDKCDVSPTAVARMPRMRAAADYSEAVAFAKETLDATDTAVGAPAFRAAFGGGENQDPRLCDCGKGDCCPLWDRWEGDGREERDLRAQRYWKAEPSLSDLQIASVLDEAWRKETERRQQETQADAAAGEEPGTLGVAAALNPEAWRNAEGGRCPHCGHPVGCDHGSVEPGAGETS